MRFLSQVLASVSLIGAFALVVVSEALATADADPVVLVHQESNGALWYNWYETPANKTFLTSSHPCWVDHDHIRLGAQDRQQCMKERP